MDYAVISTVNNLELSLHNKSNTLMCLSWLAKEHKGYRDFFANLCDDKFIILDNGANEDKIIKGAELLSIARSIGASEIVAPDVWKDVNETISETSNFLNDHSDELVEYDFGVMGVVQGKTVEEIQECVIYYAQQPRITTIGIGFNNYDLVEFPTINPTQRNSLARHFIVRFINSICKKPIHLLGNYNPYELNFYKGIPNIRSTDSSSPVLCAHYDIAYGEHGLDEKPSKFLDFFGTLTPEQEELAKKNIDTLQGWISE